MLNITTGHVECDNVIGYDTFEACMIHVLNTVAEDKELNRYCVCPPKPKPKPRPIGIACYAGPFLQQIGFKMV